MAEANYTDAGLTAVIREELARRAEEDRDQIVLAMRHLTGNPTLEASDVGRLTPGALRRLGQYLRTLPPDQAVDFEDAVGPGSVKPMPPRPQDVATTAAALDHAASALERRPRGLTDACAFLDRALELDARGEDDLQKYGMTRAAGLYRRAGWPEAGLRCAEGVIRTETRAGDEFQARTTAAAAAMDLGDAGRASRLLAPVIDRRPEDPYALFTLSRLRVMQGEVEEAVALHAKAEQLLPDTTSRGAYSLDRELKLTQDHLTRHGDPEGARTQGSPVLRTNLIEQPGSAGTPTARMRVPFSRPLGQVGSRGRAAAGGRGGPTSPSTRFPLLDSHAGTPGMSP